MDIKIALRIYTHLDKKFKCKNMDKLDEYLKRDPAVRSQERRYKEVKTLKIKEG